MDINNTSSNTFVSGTEYDDIIINSGANVTINSGAGNDSISLGSEAREYVGFSTVSAETVSGFALGTNDSSDAIYLVDCDFTEITFDFTPADGFNIAMRNGYVFIEADSDTTNTVDIIMDNKKVRAVGDSLSTAFDTDVDYYRLSDQTTLTGATGTINVNDVIIESKDVLTITSYTTTGGNGMKYNFVDHIYGVTAGNSLSIKNYDGKYDATVYNTELVNNTTAQIIRADTNKVVWTGTPSELAALDFMEVDTVQYFLDKVKNFLEDNITSYVFLQDDELTFDLKSLRSTLDTQFAQANDAIYSQTEVTADNAIKLISANWYDKFGLTLEKLFSERMINSLKRRIANNIQNNKGIFDDILNDIDTDGLRNYINNHFLAPLNSLGYQVTAKDFADFINGESILEDTIAGAIFDNVFANENVSDMMKTFIHDYKADIKQRILDKNSDNHIDIVLEGTQSTLKAGLYVGSSTKLVDASATSNNVNIIATNFDNSVGESVIGSSGDDLIYVGAGDSVNSGSGNDRITFASGSESVVTQTIDISNVTSVSDFFDKYFVSSNFYDDHSRQYIGLGANSTETVFGFEVGTEDYSDVVYLMDGSLSDLTVSYDSSGFNIDNGSGTLLISSRNAVGISSTTTRTPQSADDNILVMDTSGNISTLNASGVTLNNDTNGVEIGGNFGDNVITNSGSNVTISGGASDNTITNSGTNVSINSGGGDNYITNEGTNSTISGGAGIDTIINSGDSASISGGTGENIIANSGDNASISGGTGTNDITNTGDNVSITGGSGNDTINNVGDSVAIEGGAGENSIYTNGSNVNVTYGDGNNYITLGGSNSKIIAVKGYATVRSFDSSDLLVFADGRRDKYVDFESGGLLFKTDTSMSPNADFVQIIFPEIKTTTKINLQYGTESEETNVFIADNDIYNVSTGAAKEYIGATENRTHGVSFAGISDDINITLESAAEYTQFWNIHSVIGGNGKTTITGTSSADTLMAGNGATTLNGYGGNDFLIGNGKTYFNLKNNTNATLVAKVGDTLGYGDSDTVVESDTRYILANGNLSSQAAITGDEYVRLFNNENVSLGGGKDTISAPDNVTISGYNPSSGSVFVTDFGNVTNAIRNNSMAVGDATFSTGNGTVYLADYDTANGNFVNFVNNGASQIYGWNNAEGYADGSSYSNAVLIGTRSNVTLLGGKGNDTIYGNNGDFINAGAGTNLVTISADRNQTANGANIRLDTGVTSTNEVYGFNNALDDTGDMISGVNFNTATVTLKDGLLTIKDGRATANVNDIETFGTGTSTVIGSKHEYTKLLLGSSKAAIASAGSVIDVTSGDDFAVAYIGDASGVDWSSYNGSANINLNSSVGTFSDTQVSLKGINKLKAGNGASTLIGSSSSNTLAAGAGETSIWGGSKAGDLLVGYGAEQVAGTTFFYLDGDGSDTIDNFNFMSADTVNNADSITTAGNAVTTVKVNGNDVSLNFARTGDKLVLKDALGNNFNINGVTAKVGVSSLTYDGIADYYQAVGRTASLNVASSVDSAEIWLDGSHDKTFVGNITNLSAASLSGQSTLVGNDNNNVITASNGNSSLWGGNSGNDVLVGGNGSDMFFYTYGNGKDTIRNASAADSINLFGVTLNMIENVNVTNGYTDIKFTDGGSLRVEGTANTTYITEEGSYVYDRFNAEWNSSN